MSIWYRDYQIDELINMGKQTMMESLGMELVEIGEDFLAGRMPIDHRTVQPMGILHGGASVALAETLGSLGSYMVIDPTTSFCVGQVITANHIRPGKSGCANGKATILHRGRTSQIWNIDITDDDGKLLCVCRLTMAIVRKQ